MPADKLIEVADLRVHFPVKTGFLDMFKRRKTPLLLRAVDGVSFGIGANETMSLVGETGSGKTTLARAMLRLIDATSGKVFFDGQDLFQVSANEMRKLRRQMQIVFQDPFASLNPRKTIGEIVGRPLVLHGIAGGTEARRYAAELLEAVGLSPGSRFLDRYPHEFSGGQRQRIGIARALAPKPRLLVLDEPVSSLDISIRSQILNLLQKLKSELGLTYFLIAHDLSVVRYLSDTVGVMYLGRIVEMGESESLFENPKHLYTRALLASIPIPDPAMKRQKIRLRGEMPSPINLPRGCKFHPRCPNSKKICTELEPKLAEVDGHLVACHLEHAN